MSAQIIQLSDRRRTDPKPSASLIDLPLSILAAYTDMSLAIYLSVVNAAEHGLKAARLLR
jgi:hypothetical protein